MKNVTEEFRRFLNMKIIEKNLTLNELSLRSGISASAISRILNRKSCPNLYTVEKLLIGLNCDIKDFVNNKM